MASDSSATRGTRARERPDHDRCVGCPGPLMSVLVSDPVVLGECAVIVLFGAFDVWWFLPAQRRKRRRDQARDRALLRQLLSASRDGAAVNARTPTLTGGQRGPA